MNSLKILTQKNKSNFQESTIQVKNKKAFYNYFIQDKYEAGIVLKGTEIQSIRQGKIQITEAFIGIEKNEIFLYNASIHEYKFGNINNHSPLRPRKLLLNRSEINKLKLKIKNQGFSILPLRVYFKKSFVKIEIGTGKGKKQYDKRITIKKKEALREVKKILNY